MYGTVKYSEVYISIIYLYCANTRILLYLSCYLQLLAKQICMIDLIKCDRRSRSSLYSIYYCWSFCVDSQCCDLCKNWFGATICLFGESFLCNQKCNFYTVTHSLQYYFEFILIYTHCININMLNFIQTFWKITNTRSW